MSDGAPSLAQIGFGPFFEDQLVELDGGLVPARIAIAHGESYVVWTREGVRKAVLAGRRLATWRTPAQRPQVGDWVTGTYSDSAAALVIDHLLERRTSLVRRAAGVREEAQIIAANVDVVGIVSAFGEGQDAARDHRLINPARLGRYLAAVEQSRARPVLILNKSDLSTEPESVAEALMRRFPGVPVVSISARRGRVIDDLRPWIGPGQTLVMVGMSGVGKSTLVNALLDRSAQQVADVREADARGRHTTTHRELFLTESGALLIDTPGMREMGLWEVEDVASFDDVEAVAATCRFSDCRHLTEPACAVRTALQSGALSAERWDSYRQQQQTLREKDARSQAISEAHLRGRRGRRQR